MQAQMMKAAKAAAGEIVKQAAKAAAETVVNGIKNRVSDIAASLNPFASSSSDPAATKKKKK